MRHMAVAVIPAAGTGSRLGDATPGSKEVADVGGRPLILHLFDRLMLAGIGRAVVVTRADKTDLHAVLSAVDGVDLRDLEASPSELHSVAAGVAGIEEAVALAYPDIIFDPPDAFSPLIHRLEGTRADLVLGLFPAEDPERVDMVALDDAGRPTEIVIKQPDRGLRYSWTMAAWGPRFTEFLVNSASAQRSAPVEPSVGDVVQAALDAGILVAAVTFEHGSYIDVGSPEGLAEARRFAGA